MQLADLTEPSTSVRWANWSKLYSARSVSDYDAFKLKLHDSLEILAPPFDIFDRALGLQCDLAHHHGMWHRTAVPDLVIAETALHHGVGIVHVDRDFDRIAEVVR